jgi:hypothetical protein
VAERITQGQPITIGLPNGREAVVIVNVFNERNIFEQRGVIDSAAVVAGITEEVLQILFQPVWKKFGFFNDVRL